MPRKREVRPHEIIKGFEILREVEKRWNERAFEVVCPHCKKPFITILHHILTGHTKSCGCLKLAVLLERNTTHGLRHHPLYKIWLGIRARCGVVQGCDKKTLKNYAERGITVCDEWRDDFMAFYNWAITHGWSKGLEIDRKNNELGYSPENCHFVTRSRNQRNTRKTLRLGNGEPLIDYLERHNVPIYANDHYSKIARRYVYCLKTTRCVQGFLFPLNAR